jgi:hypothetical protein
MSVGPRYTVPDPAAIYTATVEIPLRLLPACYQKRDAHVVERMTSYSLADLVDIVGAKRRSLQLWADAGAIKAEPESDRAGRGVHRHFSRDEAIIACILHAFASRTIAIGELRSIGDVLRRRFMTEKREAIVRAINDECDCYLAVIWTEDYRYTALNVVRERGRPPVWPEFTSLSAKGSFAAVVMLNPYLAGIK